MNIILAALCLAILLRSSLLRRRASFAPAMAVGSMAVVMAVFMSAMNMMSSITDFVWMTFGVVVTLIVSVFLLCRK